MTVVFVLFAILVSALVSAAETALGAASRTRLREMADRGRRGAALAATLAEDGERRAGPLLVANTLARVMAGALAAQDLARAGTAAPGLVAGLAVTAALLALADVLPRTLAATHPEGVAARLAPAVAVLVAGLSPLVALLRGLARALLSPFGVKADPEARILAAREELAGAIAQGHSEGAVEKEARDRLLGALDLSHRTVDEIMRHRSGIEMIDAALPPAAMIDRALASPHTRLPLYRDEEENIVGVLHAKDLLREVHRLRVEGADIATLDAGRIAMKPYFIPDTTTLDEQMREFLARRSHFALVVDEYGALQGLITLEDILEEIVGEITDEMDVVVRDGGLKRARDGDYLVDGAMTIRDLNRRMDWHLPDDEANTLAGLVIHEAMTIPEEGQVFRFHGFRFEIATRRDNRVARLKVRPI
ncbi:MAG: CNNM domain-containing protein [Paracoccaceae bacterium]